MTYSKKMSLTIEWELGGKTDPGLKRKGAPNQDAILLLPGEDGRAPLLLVADGMGGHQGGETASRIVVEAVRDCYLQASTPIADYGALLADCLHAAHQAIRAHARKQPELEGMGSAAVLAVLDGETLHVANVGDSRAYLLRGRDMRQVSFDHSEVADQVRAGAIDLLQSLHHPRRNRLTQAINARRPTISPFVGQARLEADDTILLCSDGLWGVVAEAVVQAVALEFHPAEAAEKLVTLATARQAPDNVSVLLARRQDARPQSLLADDADETNPGL
jgi:protein phosphatase